MGNNTGLFFAFTLLTLILYAIVGRDSAMLCIGLMIIALLCGIHSELEKRK